MTPPGIAPGDRLDGRSFLLASRPRLAFAAPFLARKLTGIATRMPVCRCRRVPQSRGGTLQGAALLIRLTIHIVTGNARYCLVSGDRAALCMYEDYTRAATVTHGRTGQA